MAKDNYYLLVILQEYYKNTEVVDELLNWSYTVVTIKVLKEIHKIFFKKVLKF